jgi:hypothetical protein
MKNHRVRGIRGELACATALATVLATMPLLASQDTAAPASITVMVPATATITFDGHPTKESGTERLFVTPPLAPGKTFD